MLQLLANKFPLLYNKLFRGIVSTGIFYWYMICDLDSSVTQHKANAGD